jgi:hypothetical protein
MFLGTLGNQPGRPLSRAPEQPRSDGGRFSQGVGPDEPGDRCMSADTFKSRITLYRRQADETRSKAGQVADGSTRALMEEVAEAWDRLAELEKKDPQLPSN